MWGLRGRGHPLSLSVGAGVARARWWFLASGLARLGACWWGAAYAAPRAESRFPRSGCVVAPPLSLLVYQRAHTPRTRLFSPSVLCPCPTPAAYPPAAPPCLPTSAGHAGAHTFAAGGSRRHLSKASGVRQSLTPTQKPRCPLDNSRNNSFLVKGQARRFAAAPAAPLTIPFLLLFRPISDSGGP